jgi:hypothetical protein
MPVIARPILVTRTEVDDVVPNVVKLMMGFDPWCQVVLLVRPYAYT